MEAALAPVFLASRLLGVAAAPGPSCPQALYSSAIALCLLVISAVAVYSISNPHSVLRISLERFQVAVDGASAVFSVGTAFLERRQLWGLVGELREVDGGLGAGGFPSSLYLRAVLLRLGAVGLAVGLGAAHGDEIDLIANLARGLSLFLTFAIAHLVENQHNTLLHTVRLRFRRLVSRLAEVKAGRWGLAERESELTAMVRAYNRLVEVCLGLNQLYGKQILLIVGNIFILTTKNANKVVEGIIALVLNLQDDQNLLELFTHAYIAALRLLELWSVIRACEEVKIQARNFSSSLYQYIIEEGIDTSRNKKLRLHLTVQREPYFSAYGFFPLDFTLLHSIIAAATTYLVILIQFSQSSMTTSSHKPANSTNSSINDYSYYINHDSPNVSKF